MNTFGPVFEREHDEIRLCSQRERIRDAMLSAGELGIWHTLSEIEKLLHYPQASISAQLRHLRKSEFGGYIVDKRPRGDRDGGLFEYQVHPAAPTVATQLNLLDPVR